MSSPPSNSSDVARRALQKIRQLQGELQHERGQRHEPVAIVGMACRFPGAAHSPQAFWSLLRDGVDTAGEVPPLRWSIDRFYDATPGVSGKMYTRRGCFVDDVDQFDAGFFGIVPREAQGMDPQQRLLLEVTWEALEDAGQAVERLSGRKVGVYLGQMNQDYLRRDLGMPIEEIDHYAGLGNTFSVSAGRVAYVLGVQGPTLTVDTACSSSLVSLHLACQGLRAGECELALAAGVNLQLAPVTSTVECGMRMLAADGRCKTFDAGADGFVRGDGCGVLVLRRLSDAIARRERILAVVRGSAVNHDGASGALTVPNGLAQERVIRDALRQAGVEPAQVSYVETHGTGTALGDPIEVGVLGQVFARSGGAAPLLLGAVKTNIGHTEGAAGVAGVIKTVLALQHEEIPPNLHFRQPNPHIPWRELAVRVPVQRTPWPRGAAARVAGVSSFGLSGTNAHALLAEAPLLERSRPAAERPLHLLTLSARTPQSLRELAQKYRDHLDVATEAIGDICYTANAGRSHFDYRLSVQASDCRGLAAALQAQCQRMPPPVGEPPPLVWLVGGGESEEAALDDVLYATHPLYREHVEECLRLLEQAMPGEELSCSVKLCVRQVALGRLWRDWGVQPEVMVAAGAGEYAAACLSGVMSLADALRLAQAASRRDVAGAAAAYAEAVRGVQLHAPRQGYVSALEGREVGVEAAQAAYWLKPGRGAPTSPAADAMQALLPGQCLALEIGPHGGWERLLQTLGRLYEQGAPIDWEAFDRPYARWRVALPTYAFQRQRHWLPAAESAPRRQADAAAHPLLGSRLLTPGPERRYAQQLAAAQPAWLADHQVQGRTVFPAAAFIEMACAAGGMGRAAVATALADLQIHQRLALPQERELVLSTVYAPDSGVVHIFALDAAAPGGRGWVLHASARLVPAPADAAPDVALAPLRQRLAPFDPARFYAAAAQAGLHYGPAFRNLGQCFAGPGEALALLTLPGSLADCAGYRLHPVLLDGCLQAAGCALQAGHGQPGAAIYLPVSLERCDLAQPAPRRLWCHARLREPACGLLLFDLDLADADGRRIGRLTGLGLRKAALAADDPARAGDEEGVHYEVQWPEQARAAAEAVADGPGVWLLAGSVDGLGAALSAQLQARGWRSRQADLETDDWSALLQSLRAAGGVQGVVQLAGVDDSAEQAGLPPAGRESWRTTLRLTQALLDAGLETPGGLWLVTRGAQAALSGQALPGLAHTPLWGLGRSLMREQGRLGCRLVDLEPGAARDAEAAALAQELLSPDRETQLAYRAGRRHVARLRRRAAPPCGALSLDAQASYLVAGGLKGLGLQVAEWLAERGARHLVLLGREAAGAAARERLDALRQAGVQVLALQADISRREQLQQALRQAGAALPALKGVIDCAAVLRDGVLENQDEASFEQALAPKVQGAWHLHESTADQPLSFFVLFSSLASVTGSAGQTNYAAGNAFLDGLAQQRRSQGLAGLSVNWGAWSGSGLAARQGLQQRLQAGGVTLIEARQGLQWLEALLAAPAEQTGAQVVVAPLDWRRLGIPPSGASAAFFDDVTGRRDEMAGSAAASALRARLKAAPMAGRRAQLLSMVQAEIARAIALQPGDELSPEQRLFDLGLDSLIAIEVRSRLQALVGQTLRPTLLFDFPSAAAIADHLMGDVLALDDAPPVAGPGADELAQRLSEKLRRLRDRETASEQP